MRAPVVAGLVALLCAAAVVRAADGTRWLFDPARSEAGFKVRLFGLIPLAGRFERFGGRVMIDRGGASARVEMVLDTGSARMRRPDHTTWLQSAEFFDAARHPEIRFRSDPFPLTRIRAGGEVGGRLTLRGVERPVTLTLAPGDCDPVRAEPCTVAVSGSVQRSDFGMLSRRGAVSDRVALTLVLHAEPEPGTRAPR